MRLYSAKVRIGGSRDHEVLKHNLSAPELKLLEMLHVSPQGHPVLVDIKHTGDVNRTDAKERARLGDIYTRGELVEDRGSKIINSLFGLPGVPLPQEYVADAPVEAVAFDTGDEDAEVITPVAPAAAPKRTKVDPPKAADSVVG